MKKAITGLVLCALAALPGDVLAGKKVDNVKQAVRDKCNKEIPPEILMSCVVRAYDCEPSQEITIVGCKIKCLKEEDGNVVGK